MFLTDNNFFEELFVINFYLTVYNIYFFAMTRYVSKIL